MLRFGIKSPVPFMPLRHGGIIEVPLNVAKFSKKVKGEDIQLSSRPLGEARAFTEEHLNTSSLGRQREGKGSLGVRLAGLNSALVNAWPMAKQNTKRMFLRDGMAYVHLPDHGNCKMDLWHCELLDRGRPLAETMVEDRDFQRGVAAWFRNFLST